MSQSIKLREIGFVNNASNKVRHARLRLDLRQLSPFVQRAAQKSPVTFGPC